MDVDANVCERTLVGHLLNNFENDKEIFTKLTFLDFNCPILGRIYDNLKQLYDEGIDRKASIKISHDDALKMVASFVVKLGNNFPRVSNPSAYADIIKEKAVQRRLVDSIRISESSKTRQFEEDLEEFCDYLEETAEEMRNLEFTKGYSKDILETINRQMKQLIAKCHTS